MFQVLKRKKKPQQLVQLALSALDEIKSESLDEEGKQTAFEEITNRLDQIKIVLYGDEEQKIDEKKIEELSTSIISQNLMLRLIREMDNLPFEARKDTTLIFNGLIRHDAHNFVEHIAITKGFMDELILCYENPNLALHAGTILRQCVRYEVLACQLLTSDKVWLFFDKYVHVPNFDVASDAFQTLRELLTRNKTLAAEFLETKYSQVFEKYQQLLTSANYVTKRQSLRLLGELLMDRANFDVMIRFISERQNLILIMNLFREKSINIQYEAFHVFKIFVANPRKPPEIEKILFNNKEKLIALIEKVQKERERDDEQFREEKEMVLKNLKELEYIEENEPKIIEGNKEQTSTDATNTENELLSISSKEVTNNENNLNNEVRFENEQEYNQQMTSESKPETNLNSELKNKLDNKIENQY